MDDFSKAAVADLTDLFGEKVKKYLSDVRAVARNPVTGKHPVWLIHESFPFSTFRDDIRDAACAVLVTEALSSGLNGMECHQFELVLDEDKETPLARVLSAKEMSIGAFVEKCRQRHDDRLALRIDLA